jgi:hypothetical protein
LNKLHYENVSYVHSNEKIIFKKFKYKRIFCSDLGHLILVFLSFQVCFSLVFSVSGALWLTLNQNELTYCIYEAKIMNSGHHISV